MAGMNEWIYTLSASGIITYCTKLGCVGKLFNCAVLNCTGLVPFLGTCILRNLHELSEILPKGGIPISFSDTAVLFRIWYSTGRVLVYCSV